MSDERRALRSRFWNIGSGGLLCALAAMCGALAFIDVGSGTDTRALVILSLVSLTLVGGAVRLFVSGVTVTPDGLTVRELFRTTRL